MLIMVGLNSTIFAQLPKLLTLENCIHLAEEHSFQLQADDREIIVSENTAAISETYALPRISGELAMDNRFLQPYYFNQVWAGVHADWSLGDFIKKTGRSSLQDIETRKLEKEQHRLDVVGRSIALYMSILQVRKQMEILEQRMSFLQHHYKVSEGMWKAGLKSKLDVLQTEAEIVKLQEDVARLAIVKENLGVELAQLLGYENGDGLKLESFGLDSMLAGPVPLISVQSLSNNPLLLSYDSRLTAQQFRTDEISSGQIPHISMGSAYVADADPTGDGNYMQIQAGVSIPIYSGKAFTFKKQESKAIEESLVAQRSVVEQEIFIHLLQIQKKLISIKSMMELQDQRLNLSSQAVDIAEVNYEAGITSNLDYITSLQQQISTELTIEETHLEYIMSLIEFYITNNQVDMILEMGAYQNEN